MTDKQILGGRGSAKPYTTLNTIEVMLENEKLKEVLKAKEQECERYKDKFNHIKKSLERIVKSHDVDFDNGLLRETKRIIKECEVLDE